MNVAVCTLFEKDYHLGVAVLANSLHACGYRGTLWAGYRGRLPDWAAAGRSSDGICCFSPRAGLTIAFVPLTTSAHLTNYKPDFMLELLAGRARDAEAIFYLDPDIVVNEPWRFFEEWVTCGVALCEDINSPVAQNHPRRIGWRRFFSNHGLSLAPGASDYANGGLVGVARTDEEFLQRWKRISSLALEFLGGSDIAGIAGGRARSEPMGFADCFRMTDQDTLNAAVEIQPALPASFLNRQAMGFQSGHAIVPHSVGPEKPWRKKFMISAVQGRGPAAVDKVFWRLAGGPCQAFSTGTIRRRRAAITLAGAMARFVRRS